MIGINTRHTISTDKHNRAFCVLQICVLPFCVYDAKLLCMLFFFFICLIWSLKHRLISAPSDYCSNLSGWDYSEHQQRPVICHTKLSVFLLFVVWSMFPLLLSHPHTLLITVSCSLWYSLRKCYIYRDKSLSYGFGKTGTWVTVWESNVVTLPKIEWIWTWTYKQWLIINDRAEKQLVYHYCTIKLAHKKKLFIDFDTSWSYGQTWNGKSMSQSTTGSFYSNGNRFSGVEEDECWHGSWQPVVVREREREMKMMRGRVAVSSGTQVKR